MRNKKILIVTTVPETLTAILTGQPKFLSQIYDVELATSPGSEIDDLRKIEQVKVNTIRMHRGISPLKDIISIISLTRLCLQIKPDIIHSYTGKAGLIAMIAGVISRVPHRIHTFTGLLFPTQSGLKKIILMWVDRIICWCATTIVPEGDGVKKDLLDFKITKKPLDKIWNGNIAGVDINYYDNSSVAIQKKAHLLRQKINIPPDCLIYIYVGRINKDKGIKELTEAFLKINKPSRLIIVGAIDKTAPPDQTTLNLLSKSSTIHMLGFMKDIRPALAAADVLILPSYREGFPNVILQAGSMRLPVIATDINGSNEIIKNGFNGWLVKPRDVHSLLKAMENAYDIESTVRMQMGKSSRRLIIEKFDRDQFMLHLIKFYRNLVG